ncbi:MAG: serpin family protein [Bryobacterales bacterium]|nr:serpin family protein [Bryobacterales bacterium]
MKASGMRLGAILMMTVGMAHGGDPAAAANAINRFGLALHKVLPKPTENLVYSPFSVAAAMSMTLAGARGRTASEIASALSLQHPDTIHADLKDLMAGLITGAGSSDKLAIANALWPQQGANILTPFLETVRQNYQAESKALDFQRAAEPSRQEINRWVADHTAGKILDLLGPGTITPLTRLVLTNAIYFKGSWASAFDPTRTSDEPFYLNGGSTVSTPMMHRDGRYAYSANGDMQVLELPYKDGRLSMVIVLPAKKDGLAKLESQLTDENLRKWAAAGPARTVHVALPKFKLGSAFSLNDALRQIGIRDAFSDAADFSGINGQKNLSLTAVVHKAMIEVNEQGTEAAAATGAVIGLTSTMRPEPDVFRADHPFLYLIRDRKTNCLLFAGRVVNPKI